MAELTDREIEILNREIDKQGLTYTLLQKELLDHLCCDIEAKMDEGVEFLKAFEEIRSRLENNRIQEIQEETLLLINQKYRMMKKFMYILGTIAPSLLIIGAIFKLQHWPGAGVALTVSVFLTVAVFIPILVIHALRDKENQVQNFSILIFVLSFMAVNIMVFALRVSKNVLTSMAVSAKVNMKTSQMVESANTLFLQKANMEEQLSPDLLATHEDNQMAVAEDGSIDLSLTNYLDVHESTELVIFGSESETGKGAVLLNALDTHMELLLAHAGPELDSQIKELLDISGQYPDEDTWLIETFGKAPMIAAIISLSNLQFKLHFLEGEVLKELL